jgi:hypothetical protein
VDPSRAQGGGVSDGYLGDERLNELARLCMALLREVWILRDRQLVLEKILGDKHLIDRDGLEDFDPDPQHEERIQVEVDRLIDRVFVSTFRAGPPDLDQLVKQVHEELAAEAKLGRAEYPKT